jgi:TetR/AcrR family transcriptional repressor of nem operon
MNGEISSDYSAEAMAEFLYTSFEGALVRMQVNNELSPVNHFINFAIDRIIPEP